MKEQGEQYMDKIELKLYFAVNFWGMLIAEITRAFAYIMYFSFIWTPILLLAIFGTDLL